MSMTFLHGSSIHTADGESFLDGPASKTGSRIRLDGKETVKAPFNRQKNVNNKRAIHIIYVVCYGRVGGLM